LVERQVAVVCFDESVHQRWIHIRILRLRPVVPLLGQNLSSLYFYFGLRSHAQSVFGMQPDQDPEAGDLQRSHGQSCKR
jgi:hypothetical protein